MSYYESLRTTDILWNMEHASRRSEIKIRNVCMLMKKLADIFSLAVFMQYCLVAGTDRKDITLCDSAVSTMYTCCALKIDLPG